jgi:cytochrome c peroxidase
VPTPSAGRRGAGPLGYGWLSRGLAAVGLAVSASVAPVIVPPVAAQEPGEPTSDPAASVLDLFMPALDGLVVTDATIALGRSLFNDARLSADGSMRCASCHDPNRAFASNGKVAVGVGGHAGPRNVPAIVNRGYGAHFSWDGRGRTLLEQVLLPIENPLELNVSVDTVVARLSRDATRVREFRRAFGQPPSRSTLAWALTAYVSSITSENAPFDLHFQGDTAALDLEARRGRRLFLGKAGCTRCHVGPNLTDERFHVTGVAWRSGRPDDPGRFAITGDSTQLGAFKTPTLREVERTAPYMHDGSIPTLEEVVEFYSDGGIANPYLDRRLRPLELTRAEKRGLVAFLRSLSGTVREGAASRR